MEDLAVGDIIIHRSGLERKIVEVLPTTILIVDPDILDVNEYAPVSAIDKKMLPMWRLKNL